MAKYIVYRQEVAYETVEASSPEDAIEKTANEPFEEFVPSLDVLWAELLTRHPKEELMEAAGFITCPACKVATLHQPPTDSP